MPLRGKRCGTRAGQAPALREQLAAVGAITPDSALKKVVLPAPLGPMMPTSSPGAKAALHRVDRGQAAEAHRHAAGFEQRAGRSCTAASFRRCSSRALSPLHHSAWPPTRPGSTRPSP
jgi:hypothetical protein